MSLVGCQINLINVNFHLKITLEIFDKDSAVKNLIQKGQGWKVPSLMPIRVNRPKCIVIFGQNWDIQAIVRC